MGYTGRKPSSAPLTSAGIENGTIEEVDLDAALSGKINDKYTQAETDAKIVELAPTSGVVDLTTAQSVGGIKTFTSFPVTPSAAPTTDYQVANKKYVDDEITNISFPTMSIQQQNDNSLLSLGDNTVRLNTVLENSIPGASLNSFIFTLPTGKYEINGGLSIRQGNTGRSVFYSRLNDGTSDILQGNGAETYDDASGTSVDFVGIGGVINLTSAKNIEWIVNTDTTLNGFHSGVAAFINIRKIG